MKAPRCRDCTNYSAYYKKYSDEFVRLHHGFCVVHNKNQTGQEACECFKSNEQKEKRREKTMLIYLERALKSINDIAQILKEKENDKLLDN